ncbi:MAG: hypothetical protein AAGC43_14415 [Bacteroidota bacterium]
MTTRLIVFCIFLCSLGIVSCKKEKTAKNNKLSLDPRYLEIEKINSFANCNGPNGDYITEIKSDKNGELFFSQVFEYRDLPFIAQLSSDGKGYTFDKNGKVSDTLSNISIEVIRSHDFHRLQTNPKSFFHEIKFEKDVKTDTKLYSGVDRLNNPVKIYYDKSIKQIRIIEFLNMMDTTEVIKIEYKKWIESEYGKLVKEIEIVQAKKDTFYFNFKKIEINKQ